MATNYKNLLCHLSISESTPKIIDDTKTLRFVGTANSENIVDITEMFAVKVMDAIDDEIVKKVIEEAKAAGINDVYLMDRNFIRNAIQRAITIRNEPPSLKMENNYLHAKAYIQNDHIMTLEAKVKIQEDEIKNLKNELAKARGGCKRLREGNEELQKCVQTIKKCFDEERDARINRDKEYSQLFVDHEKLKNKRETPEYRKCYVEGREALFHGWFAESSQSYSQLIETKTVTYGLVEFEGGNLKKVSPFNIRFADNKCIKMWEGKE